MWPSPAPHSQMHVFFDAIEAGDIQLVAGYLERDRSVANSVDSRTKRIDPQWREKASRIGDGSFEDPPKPELPRKNTALHVAAQNGQTEVARLLLDCGAQVNAVNKTDHTPLHVAMMFRARALNIELIELLVSRGADVNARTTNGDIPIVMAFGWRRDPLPAIECFLRNGADINATGQQGKTALDYAMIFLGHLGIMRLVWSCC